MDNRELFTWYRIFFGGGENVLELAKVVTRNTECQQITAYLYVFPSNKKNFKITCYNILKWIFFSQIKLLMFTFEFNYKLNYKPELNSF